MHERWSVKQKTLLFTLLIWLLPGAAVPGHAADTGDSLKVVSKTNQNAIDSQQRIDGLAVQTSKMLEEYQQILRKTEYQDSYNFQLRQLQADQEAEIASLEQQLEDINITQLRIMPLINSMADSLEKFIVLDLPFRQQERVAGVTRLKQRLRSPGLSLPEKYRLLLEAFQIENDYGRSIETYRDNLSIEGASLSVEFLRIGRVALFYRTLDGEGLGRWDGQAREWQDLPEASGRDIAHAMRVAGKQLAPQLMTLPLVNAP
jgi:hypothetical protein